MKTHAIFYIKNTCKVNDKIEIEKHYPWSAGAPGCKREKKHNKTPEEVAKMNMANRTKELRRLLELNFEPGDLHVTLTCKPDQRPDKKDALKVIRRFRDELRNIYKRNKWMFKYIITCETGKRGAVHWHMIINNCQNDKTSTTKVINGLWKRGRPYFTALEDNREYGQLADYIVKESSKRIQEGDTMEKLAYMRSRNLKKPVVRKKKVRARKWKKIPKPPKGYYLEAESLVNGHISYTGMPYQHYTVRKIEDSGGVVWT